MTEITEMESRKRAATEYIKRHDERVKVLDRKSNAALRNIYLAEMGDANEILLMGGPQGHDELVNAIIEMEFPDIASVREAYAQSVADGECPACGSGVRTEFGYVPGRTGMPVSCCDEWHEET